MGYVFYEKLDVPYWVSFPFLMWTYFHIEWKLGELSNSFNLPPLNPKLPRFH